MKNLYQKLEPTDIIAIIVIIGAFILLYYNRDGIMSATLTMIVGYYFGKRTRPYPPFQN